MGWTRFGESVLVHGSGLAWYPKNQTPLDKATYDVRITFPKPHTATANGELIATIDNGDTWTYVWELKVPVGGVAFAVSDSVLNSIAGPDDLVINNYFPSDFAQFSIDRFDIVPEIIELFTDQLGPFPFETFGITFLRGPLPFNGFGPPQRVFLLSASDGLIAHEIAHQWFGAAFRQPRQRTTGSPKVSPHTPSCSGLNINGVPMPSLSVQARSEDGWAAIPAPRRL